MGKKTKSPKVVPLSEALRSWQGARTQSKAASDLGANVRTYQNWVQGRTEPKGLALRTVYSTISQSEEADP